MGTVAAIVVVALAAKLFGGSSKSSSNGATNLTPPPPPPPSQTPEQVLADRAARAAGDAAAKGISALEAAFERAISSGSEQSYEYSGQRIDSSDDR